MGRRTKAGTGIDQEAIAAHDASPPEVFDAWQGSENLISRALQKMNEQSERPLTQEQWASQTSLKSQTRVSQALKTPRPAWLKLTHIEELAKAVGFVARLVFVKDDRHRATEVLGREDFWLPMFWLGLVFTDHRRVPASIVDILCQTTGADFATVYEERRKTNSFICSHCAGVNRPEAMAGVSWETEAPIMIARRGRIEELKTPVQSLFREREGVEAAIGVPFGGRRQRVLFLNYKQKRNFSDNFKASLQYAAAVLGSILDSASSVIQQEEVEPKERRGEHRNFEPSGRLIAVLDALTGLVRKGSRNDAMFTEADARRIDVALKYYLPHTDQIFTRLFTKKASMDDHKDESKYLELNAVNGDNLNNTDGVVEKVGCTGVTFFCDDLSAIDKKLEWWENSSGNASKPIRDGMRTKLSIPVRCDRLPSTDPWKPLQQTQPDEGSQPKEIIYSPDRTKVDATTFGVLDIESPYQTVIGDDSALDIGLLCARFATTLETFQQIPVVLREVWLEKFQETITNIREWNQHRRAPISEEKERKNQYCLDQLCELASGKNGLFRPADRCDIYAYNHERDDFEILGHYCEKEKPYFDPVYLLPRKGGNSVKMIELNRDVFLLIPDARLHPRVSAVSAKMMDAKSMIGFTYKLSSSFRPEGVVWLAVHEKTDGFTESYFLNQDNRRILQCFSLMVAMLAVTLRIDGGGGPYSWPK